MAKTFWRGLEVGLAEIYRYRSLTIETVARVNEIPRARITALANPRSTPLESELGLENQEAARPA